MAAERVEESSATQSRVCLPAGLIPVLPVQDQQWISKALFKWSRTGQPELDITRVDQMWWYPPQPSPAPQGLPPMERYFGHPLFLWMPKKLWDVKILCSHGDCGKEDLMSAGLHESVRQVVGVSGTYFMVSEYLVCNGCKRKVISWSSNVTQQLDIGHRVQFPCLLTSRLGCDMQVVRLMRQRGLGNRSSQVWRQLEEQHAEAWLQKQLHFLTDCSGVARAASAGLVAPVAIGDMPAMIPVPKHRWLMQVYCQDVLGRLEEIKASITSLFGRVLKMDSSKKFVKKLADESRSTVSWATSIGNEHGQVIMSVLTASKGKGLGKMIGGLIHRYQDAGVPPPEVLYVDQDCCGSTPLHSMFRTWDHMQIRLDVWHFMQRIAEGCSSSSHPLYAGFMNQLSQCIFIWDEDDVRALKEAKCAELVARDVHLSAPDHVMRYISRAEMALHCRRTTRSCTEMKTLITQLLAAYDGDRGCNTLGVPLIHSERMVEIWKVQKTHLRCLQDPPGIQLYIQTGTLQKEGHTLPTYRCARGSTSLESFHLHMNRFIPGTLASATFMQAYLVDGLARWNEDRGMAAEGRVEPHSYRGLLCHAVNQLAEQVMGLKLVNYTPPRKYTGELIGVEYLYDHTDCAFEGFKHTLSAMETDRVAVAEDEDELEPEEVEDLTVPLLDAPLLTTTSATAPPLPTDEPPAPPPGDSSAVASTSAAVSASDDSQLPEGNTATLAQCYKQSQQVPTSSLHPVASRASASLQCPVSSTSQLFIPVVVQLPHPPGPRSHQQLILPAGPCEPPVKEDVPYTTQRNRKRRQEREQMGVPRRKYTKKSDLVVCRRCQKDRRLPGHHQYFGNWYCAETATEPMDEWREHLAAKSYGRRKKEQTGEGQREREGGIKEEEQDEGQREREGGIKEEEQDESKI